MGEEDNSTGSYMMKMLAMCIVLTLLSVGIAFQLGSLIHEIVVGMQNKKKGGAEDAAEKGESKKDKDKDGDSKKKDDKKKDDKKKEDKKKDDKKADDKKKDDKKKDDKKKDDKKGKPGEKSKLLDKGGKGGKPGKKGKK